jgi:hypothetical protein
MGNLTVPQLGQAGSVIRPKAAPGTIAATPLQLTLPENPEVLNSTRRGPGKGAVRVARPGGVAGSNPAAALG